MVLSMLLFGGPALHYFALALTIGILFGIYSSVLVASPLVDVARRQARAVRQAHAQGARARRARRRRGLDSVSLTLSGSGSGSSSRRSRCATRAGPRPAAPRLGRSDRARAPPRRATPAPSRCASAGPPRRPDRRITHRGAPCSFARRATTGMSSRKRLETWKATTPSGFTCLR